MKTLITAFTMILFYTHAAHAHLGGHTLVCKSPKVADKSRVVFTLSRGNAEGYVAPKYSYTKGNKKYEFTTENDMLSFGETIHNSPLGVIRATAYNTSDEQASIKSSFTITAIPATVRAFDENGKPIKWSLELEKNSECYDSNGRANFKAVFSGWIEEGAEKFEPVEPQILDCELSYNSGMAC